jgi:hypothetical protein
MRRSGLVALLVSVGLTGGGGAATQPGQTQDAPGTVAKDGRVLNPDGTLTIYLPELARERAAVKDVTRTFSPAQRKELWLGQIAEVAATSGLTAEQRLWLAQLARHVSDDVSVPKTEANYAVYKRTLYDPALNALGRELYAAAILTPSKLRVEHMTGLRISTASQPTSVTFPGGVTCSTIALLEQARVDLPRGPSTGWAALMGFRDRCMCHVSSSNEQCGVAGMWCCRTEVNGVPVPDPYCPGCNQPESEDCGEGEFWTCHGICWPPVMQPPRPYSSGAITPRTR